MNETTRIGNVSERGNPQNTPKQAVGTQKVSASHANVRKCQVERWSQSKHEPIKQIAATLESESTVEGVQEINNIVYELPYD